MVRVSALAWVLAGMAALALLAQPVSASAQLSLSATIIFLLILVRMFGRGFAARDLFLALASFVIIRYAYWRAFYTLPALSDFAGFALGLILFAAEAYCFAILAISLVIGVDPIKRKTQPQRRDDELPTIDVFIPTYNEDETILAVTVAAARSMDYPEDKLNVWVLDDGGTDQKCNDKDPVKAEAARLRRATLQSLCARMGALYLTRARNEHAKAGNLNNGLANSKGEVVAVFDADHAPFRSFLQETASYFLDDDRLFLVQTPHVFLNPDPIEKNLRTFQRMPSENEMFYSLTQRGLDKWDASFFCGSAALLRRAALLEAGGFSGVTITEDCETAFELHSRGWHSVFVDKPLIVGLQPETFESFIGQRIRWCQGMMQIMLLKNPLFKKGLKPIQRLGYLSSMTFWLFPFPRLVFMLAPLSYIFFNVKIFVCNVDEFVAYTLTYMTANLMLQNYLYGCVRWPLISELYEYCQGVFLSKALVSVCMNPRKPTFNVTAKGLTLDNDHLSELSWPFFAIFGLLALGAAVAGYRYFFEAGVGDLMLIVGIWNAFNLVVAAVALGAVAERKQTDRHPRLPIHRTATLEALGQRLECEVANVSVSGCALRFRAEVPGFLLENDEARMRLHVDTVGRMAGAATLPVKFIRAPADGDGLWGCVFDVMAPQEYFALADLMHGDPEALSTFLEGRRKHKSVLAGLMEFARWALLEPLRAFSYLAPEKASAARAERESPPPETPIKLLRRIAADAIEPIVDATPSPAWPFFETANGAGAAREIAAAESEPASRTIDSAPQDPVSGKAVRARSGKWSAAAKKRSARATKAPKRRRRAAAKDFESSGSPEASGGRAARLSSSSFNPMGQAPDPRQPNSSDAEPTLARAEASCVCMDAAGPQSATSGRAA